MYVTCILHSSLTIVTDPVLRVYRRVGSNLNLTLVDQDAFVPNFKSLPGLLTFSDYNLFVEEFENVIFFTNNVLC